jgi:methylphosphotriester-DNA--protein-cysteine methyltransferase
MAKKHDIESVRAELAKGLSRREVAAKLGIPYSSIVRYAQEIGAPPTQYIQSEETRKKRGESLKKAHELDPTLTNRIMCGIMYFNTNRKGKTLEEVYGDRAFEVRLNISKAHKGIIPSQASRDKRAASMQGKVASPETRKKISESRKQGFKDGTIKLASRVGVGKGGFREDIGHYVRSTYEHYYAQQLKAQGKAYFYEPRTFEIEVDGQKTSFTPDFYLISEGKWIEIKNAYNATNAGFLKKLGAFQSLYPTEKIEVVIGARSWIPTSQS